MMLYTKYLGPDISDRKIFLKFIPYIRLSVNCPVSHHFYFKADSKYLLSGNKISALLLQSTIIPLNNETQFVSLRLCFESHNDFEVD